MSLLDKLKLGERHAIRVPGNGISSTGVTDIIRILNRHNVHSLDNPIPEWEWAYRVGGKGEYVGVVAKRIQKWCHQRHKIKLPAEAVSQIGNLGAQHCDKAQSYYFDFDAKFAWKKGDFGDEGSCYLPDKYESVPQKKDAIPCLIENGVLAMRFFTDDSYKTGVGRVWVIGLRNKLLCINGYWRDPGLSTSLNHGTDHTLRLARILAQWLDHAYYHQCTVHCTAEAVWINGHAGRGGSTGIGFAVGPQEHVAGLTEVRLSWNEPKVATCEACRNKLTRAEVKKSPDGRVVCLECLEKNWFECHHCARLNSLSAKKTLGDDEFCERCYSDVARTCSCCQGVKHMRDTATVNGEVICAECLPRKYFYCDCGRWEAKENAKDINGLKKCRACYEKWIMKCPHCQHEQLTPSYVVYKTEDGEKLYYNGTMFASRAMAAIYTNKTRFSPVCHRESATEGGGLCVQCGKSVFDSQEQLELNLQPANMAAPGEMDAASARALERIYGRLAALAAAEINPFHALVRQAPDDPF